MSGSPTFDTEKTPKKIRNGGILRLRLAYGRRSNNINRLIAMRNSYERTVWSFSRIQGIVENEYTNFNDRKWLESYRVPKKIFSQLCTFFNGLCGKTTQMRKPEPVQLITAMVLKRLGKFGIGASTANEKVNDAMLFLIKISYTQSVDFKRVGIWLQLLMAF